MSTPDPIQHLTSRRHTHKPNGAAGEPTCPYCGAPLGRKQYREIRARIETEERARIAKVEQDLAGRFAREKGAIENHARTALAKVKKEAARLADQRVKEL